MNNIFDIAAAISEIENQRMYAESAVSYEIVNYDNKLELLNELTECKLYSEYTRLMDEFDEINEDGNGIIQEGFVTSIKTFLKKAVAIFKKFFSFIGNSIKNILDRLFGKSKVTQTPDQICERLIKSVDKGSVNDKSNGPSKKAIAAGAAAAGTITVAALYAMAMKRKKDHHVESEIVHFPSAPGSVISETDLKVVAKDLVFKINEDNRAVGDVNGLAGSGFHKGPKKVHTINIHHGGAPDAVLAAFIACINNKRGILDQFEKILTMLEEYSKDNVPNEERFRNMITLSNQIDYDINMICVFQQGGRLAIRSDKLLAAQQLINKLNLRLSALDQLPENEDPRYISTIQTMTKFASAITFGSNEFSNKMKGIYMIDKRYVHTVDDLETLGTFVHDLIESGVPSKYVAYNTWLIMAEKFDNRGFFMDKRKYSATPETKPRWGQSRVVFMPLTDESVVLKIATNPVGIIGIKREHKVFELYKKAGVSGILATPLGHYGDYTIETMERLKGYDVNLDNPFDMKNAKPSALAAKTIEMLEQIHTKHPDLPIIGDIHGANIGMGKSEDGKDVLKIMDYGG